MSDGEAKTKVFRFVQGKITDGAVAAEQGNDSAGGRLVNCAARVLVSWWVVLPPETQNKVKSYQIKAHKQKGPEVT